MALIIAAFLYDMVPPATGSKKNFGLPKWHNANFSSELTILTKYSVIQFTVQFSDRSDDFKQSYTIHQRMEQFGARQTQCGWANEAW